LRGGTKVVYNSPAGAAQNYEGQYMKDNEKISNKIQTSGIILLRHPRKELLMEKEDFEVPFKVTKTIEIPKLYYNKKMENYTEFHYFKDMIEPLVKLYSEEFAGLYGGEDEWDSLYLNEMYMQLEEHRPDEQIGHFIDWLLTMNWIPDSEQSRTRGYMWDFNTLFIVFFEYYLCQIRNRTKHFERFSKIENFFRESKIFADDNKFDWANSFMKRIELFLEEGITTEGIVKSFLDIFEIEIKWE
jgi:hypothetical protein